MTEEIGRDCKWTDIVRQVFRVLEFDRAGTVIGPGDKVKAKSSFKPYGYLLVESPILNQPSRLPIVHRDDFLLAASVFDEPQWSEVIKEEELLVTYVPKHKLPGGAVGISHGLHYVISPRGTLARYYEIENNIHVANPAPEKIFGAFIWEGEIRVKINPNPELEEEITKWTMEGQLPSCPKESKYCCNCGMKLKLDSNFCHECGTEINRDAI